VSIPGRGYQIGDRDWLNVFGTASGLLSVLVLALYTQSPAVASLYRRPELLWTLLPLLLYWLGRVYLKANRGEMHDDPVVFALTDPVSLGIGAASLVVMLLAAV
jgi:hypothetical protein